MTNKFYFLLTFSVLAQFSIAQSVKLSLAESINIASDSSLQAFSAKNLYQAQYWEFRSYKAARLPSLSLRTTPIRYNRDFVSRYDSEQNIDIYRRQQTLFSYGNLSLSQNLDFTGGTFYVDSELGYLQNFGENTYSQFTTVPIRIGYSQSLFGFNNFKWERKIEPLKFEKAKRQFLYSREEISETTIHHFFNLAMAQMEYDLALENVASTDTLYKIGNERYKIASISQGDLLTLKLDAVNAKNTLKNAEINLSRAMFSFVSFLNMKNGVKIELKLPERPSRLIVSIEDALQCAKDNNPDYLTYRQELLEAEREVERTRKSSNFDASISASIGFNQVAPTFSEAYRNSLQQDVAHISLTIPIIDWGVRKGRANMAKNNLNIRKLSVQQKTAGLEEDIIMTVNDFNIQQDLISSAEEAMELATLAYNSTRQRFIIGKADINSLTLSLNRLNSAQRNYISALRNYWQSYYKLRKLTLFDFDKSVTLSYEFDKLMNLKH
ncbi:TolC family protein [Paludibacter sp. 221]|uniref:TolC family protein n=1 Tax=Paludibacter sp. 221 TaxID=2302939 RepID=UPI0013D6A9F3|nr:TolC family protein [Paludibacter sp. 221]NDV46518.1 TolC family protein [Paludibacter sp. 221]